DDLEDRDLARGEEADALGRAADAQVDVQAAVALLVEAAIEARHEARQGERSPAHRRQRDLAAMRVAAEGQLDPGGDGLWEEVWPMREQQHRLVGRELRQNRRELRVLDNAAGPVAAEVVEADDVQARAADL